VTLQRKKSLPDVQQIPVNSMMSREEVSVLGSARREEVRRQKDESERYKANPLLYLVSPQVKVSLMRPKPTAIPSFSFFG
jgi:junctophilin